KLQTARLTSIDAEDHVGRLCGGIDPQIRLFPAKARNPEIGGRGRRSRRSEQTDRGHEVAGIKCHQRRSPWQPRILTKAPDWVSGNSEARGILLAAAVVARVELRPSRMWGGTQVMKRIV